MLFAEVKKLNKGETFPVKWNDLQSPILYKAGIPTLNELVTLPSHSVVVLDDLYEQCAKSSDISYLFRVLSGKKNVHVIIMTQRYCSGGTQCLNIRNSCNIHVLLNNVDVRSNKFVCGKMGLKSEYEIADTIQKQTLHPYVVIDRSNEARVSGAQLYVDIFSPIKIVISNQMKQYLINAEDFEQHFKTISENLAVRNEDTRSSIPIASKSDQAEQTEISIESDTSSEFIDRKTKRKERRNITREIKREVRKAVHRRAKCSKLQR